MMRQKVDEYAKYIRRKEWEKRYRKTSGLYLWWRVNYRKKRYEQFKKRNLCVNCQKVPPRKNSVCCEECLLNKRLNTMFNKKPEHILCYKELLVKQQSKCAICQKITKKFVIDHKHGVDEIRGLLCSSCNTAIGLLKEDPIILNLAIQYLSKNSPQVINNLDI